MSLSIKEISDKSIWETFILRENPNSFLQSWAWGETQKQVGYKIFRLGLWNSPTGVGKGSTGLDIFDQFLIGVGLIIKVEARRGPFLHCPYGPLLNWQKPEQFRFFVDYLKRLAKQEKVAFIRINPLLENTLDNYRQFQNLGFRNAPIHMMNPELSWLLDLKVSEEEILKNMRKTTRYLIRKAAKDGIKIRQSSSEEDLKTFYEIHLDTVRRQHFVPYSYNFLKSQLTNFDKDKQIKIFLADFQGKIMAAAIIVFYGHEAAYHHAASLSAYNKIPASYLLQWEIIKEAKKSGCNIYNFWGITENSPRHPWAGLSLFKMGFGGYKKFYIHAQDLKITNRYYINWSIEKIRKWWRKY